MACSRPKKNIPELNMKNMRHSGEKSCATLRTSLPIPLSAPGISRAVQISRPRRFEAAGRRAFGSGTRCPQRVYLFRPPCAPNFRYVRCASPDYQSRSRRAPPHAELQSACGAMRPHASSRRLQQTSTSVSDVDMVATKMPAPNEVHFRPCR